MEDYLGWVEGLPDPDITREWKSNSNLWPMADVAGSHLITDYNCFTHLSSFLPFLVCWDPRVSAQVVQHRRAVVFKDIFNLSMVQAVVPICPKTTCLNNWHLHQFSVSGETDPDPAENTACLLPHQFTYKPSRSTYDAISLILHSALTLLERKNTQVQIQLWTARLLSLQWFYPIWSPNLLPWGSATFHRTGLILLGWTAATPPLCHWARGSHTALCSVLCFTHRFGAPLLTFQPVAWRAASFTQLLSCLALASNSLKHSFVNCRYWFCSSIMFIYMDIDYLLDWMLNCIMLFSMYTG